MQSFKEYIQKQPKILDRTNLSYDQQKEFWNHHGTLSEDERKTLGDYKNSSPVFNTPLRNHKNVEKNGNDRDFYKRKVKLNYPYYKDLDRITSHPIENDMVVHRGLKLEEIPHMKEGAVYKDHGYTGTTTSGPVKAYTLSSSTNAADPSLLSHIAEIHVPKGTNAHFLDLEDSDFSHENELLLHRGTKFHITHISDYYPYKEHTDSEFKNMKVKKVHMKVIGQEPESLE